MNPFAEGERSAWLPPQPLSTSSWASQHRYLSERVSAEPGLWRNERVPYAAAIMDALSDDEHQEVSLQKPVQSSGSELGRNWIGRCVDVDPGPIMVVFPDQKSAEENIEERILPMFSDSPRLAAVTTGRAWDMKKRQVYLRTCSIYIGWSGSAQALASRPIRYLFLDEVNKFRGYKGKEADPCSLAIDRTLTYKHRRKVYKVSTPTVPVGYITAAINASGDRRDYCCPCAHCGELILPSFDMVEFPGRYADDEQELTDAREALESGAATAALRCPHCEGAMGQPAWWRCVQGGQWVSEGHPPGEHPRSGSVGFRLHGLVSPWIGVDRVASEFVSARLKGLAEMQNFYNAILGVPFWSESDEAGTNGAPPGVIWDKSRAGHKRGLVPDWATSVFCGADTAKVGHQYVVRAFGPGWRSRLLEASTTKTSDELYRRTMVRKWKTEDGTRTLRVRRMCVDTGGGATSRGGSRTDDVFRFAQTDPVHICPVRGYGGAGELSRPVVSSSYTYHPPGRSSTPYDVTRSTLDVGYFKDLLFSRITSDDDTLWEIHEGISRDYVLQVVAEQRTLIERRIGPDGSGKEVWRWVPRIGGAANHFLDCEVYCLAAAYMSDAGRERGERGTSKGYEVADDDGSSWSFQRGGRRR